MDIHAHQAITSTVIQPHYNKQQAEDTQAKTEVAGAISSTTVEEEANEQIIRELSARDREVRAHEQAHKAAAGQLAQGAPTYSYQRGPNGQLYAVGGEVKIDTAPVSGDPEATLRKAEQIKRAALAPANPSAQDRAVAAQATQMATQARAEMQTENNEKSNSESGRPENQVVESEASSVECPMCGGKHSADTHIIVASIKP